MLVTEMLHLVLALVNFTIQTAAGKEREGRSASELRWF